MFKRWQARRYMEVLEKVAADRAAYRARMRTPLADLDPLVRELVEIGNHSGFLARDGRRERTEEIGSQLDRSGGMGAMLSAHQEVEYWLPFKARSLEAAWDGIGDWRG